MKRERKLMKLSLIFDFMCPFCFKQHLVLKEIPDLDLEPLPRFLKAEVPMEGLEMDPETKKKVNEAQKELGKGPLFQDVHFTERTHFYNTYLTHQMAQAAYKMGAYLPFALAVYRAYFEENKNIGQMDVLRPLAESVGLDPKAMEDLFDGDFLREKLWTSFSIFKDHDLKTMPAMVLHPGEKIIDHSTSLEEMKEILRANGY